jgi:hypothetical protein
MIDNNRIAPLAYAASPINGDAQIWKMVLNQCREFAAQYVKDGGDAKVIYLPDEGIKGNSHFMFQEMNNGEIADLVEKWLKEHNL